MPGLPRRSAASRSPPAATGPSMRATDAKVVDSSGITRNKDAQRSTSTRCTLASRPRTSRFIKAARLCRSGRAAASMKARWSAMAATKTLSQPSAPRGPAKARPIAGRGDRGRNGHRRSHVLPIVAARQPASAARPQSCACDARTAPHRRCACLRRPHRRRVRWQVRLASLDRCAASAVARRCSSIDARHARCRCRRKTRASQCRRSVSCPRKSASRPAPIALRRQSAPHGRAGRRRASLRRRLASWRPAGRSPAPTVGPFGQPGDESSSMSACVCSAHASAVWKRSLGAACQFARASA